MNRDSYDIGASILIGIAFLIGIALLAVGIFGLIIWKAPKWVNIVFIIIGILFIVLSGIFYLAWYFTQSGPVAPVAPVQDPTPDPIRDPMTTSRTNEINVFTRVIHSLWHRWDPETGRHIYRGGNNRSPWWENFFEPEIRDLDHTGKIYQRNSKNTDSGIEMNDATALYIWYLFKKYMENRFSVDSFEAKLNELSNYYRLNGDIITDEKLKYRNNRVESLGTVISKWYPLLENLFKLRNRKILDNETYRRMKLAVSKVINSLMASKKYNINTEEYKLVYLANEKFFLDNIAKEKVRRRHRPMEMVLIQVYGEDPFKDLYVQVDNEMDHNRFW